MKLKVLLLSILSLFLSLPTLAFNFAGKTFKGEMDLVDGSKAVVTLSFRANNRCYGTTKQTGKKAQSASLMWEIAGDYMNLYEIANGDLMVLGIDEDCDHDGDCETILLGYDSGGQIVCEFYQVSTVSQKSSSKKSPTRKSNRKKR